MRYCCAHPAVAAYEVAWTDPPERIAEHVARAFAPDGVFVSPWLGRLSKPLLYKLLLLLLFDGK